MNLEKTYAQTTSEKHLKSLGQFFTPYPVVQFMCSWACKGAGSVLDPAAGNSIFLSYAKEAAPEASLTGYEIDPEILSFFGNPSGADLKNENYLLSDWDSSYDAIVCNPPYHRFQAVKNRNEILSSIQEHTGTSYSSYTNLYILFLIKSLYKLSLSGKLAFIIPSEFLNSGYGTAMKEKLIREKLLRAILNFQNDEALFFNATTTCCILLIDHEKKDSVLFYNLSSMEELRSLSISPDDPGVNVVSYTELSPSRKWRSFLHREESISYQNLVPLSTFCKVSRGIATGANDFFCFSASKAAQHQISSEYLLKCICRSADIKNCIFTPEDFDRLSDQDKQVFLLNIQKNQKPDASVQEYLRLGLSREVDKKHLPSHRNPWYSMEKREIAPIWVTNASRGGMKFIRNLAGISSLTTFHSVYVLEAFPAAVDLLFCYFLTPTAQSILRQNRKELGNGLEKFQPSDLNTAMMLDIRMITDEDRASIHRIYQTLKEHTLSSDILIAQLDDIFLTYLTE